MEFIMVRARLLLYLGVAFLFALILAAINSETFSLNVFLHPVPRSPPLKKTFVEDFNKRNVRADNPLVVRTVREHFLVRPSTLPYNLSQPDEENPSMGQAQRIDYLLKGKRNGFYVECGALDGEVRSNTLFFERKRNWKGLLIEADPKNYHQMVNKRRKAYMSPTCLSPTPHPTMVMFQQQENQGHIVGKGDDTAGGTDVKTVVEVQCFPLATYLLALNVTTVDYFSLDVEGAEFDVLKTIPWEKVDIKAVDADPPIDETAPSLDEVREAVAKLRGGKAAGVCNISAELLKARGEAMTRGLHAVLTAVWQSGTIPPDWKRGLVVPIWKGKGDRQDCNNYRGITLLSVPGKVLAHLLLTRIRSHLVKYQRPQQSGFTPGKLTTDRILALRVLVERRREFRQGMLAAYVDLKKAFDSVHHESLWDLL
ncbi:Transposon TX1 uncharacterized protein [Chionoecetes opilio]|uniref:Transposon TX1 uncharacterized protein n=1 Tax=Chionoecetes opilio TaxID=41210 RepID=A0A8J4YJB3_CHIOP|nr:Transposon TX1 uncharacterized protein [Chionoecetes opilio]